jgi:hypothetical protein
MSAIDQPRKCFTVDHQPSPRIWRFLNTMALGIEAQAKVKGATVIRQGAPKPNNLFVLTTGFVIIAGLSSAELRLCRSRGLRSPDLSTEEERNAPKNTPQGSSERLALLRL